MRIGIDISQIVYEGTGVATYTSSLVSGLLKVDQENEYVLFGSSLRKRRSLVEFKKQLGATNAVNKFSFLPPKLLEFLWNGIHFFPIENFIGEVDVFHSSDWLEPPTKIAKRVTTIHDFTVYKFPETFSSRGGHDIVKNQKRKLFFVKQYSDKVIAVSETTKKDAVEILGIPEEKIVVIYEAADPIYYPRQKEEIEKVKEKFNINGEYVLCVGTREPRKNLDRLIMAFSELSLGNSKLSLVIAGKYGWGDNNLEFKIKNLKFDSRIKILGYVEKMDLAALYSGAKVFVLPSLYEGFGLPILEAMSCGCPVVISDVGSMKEISASSAILVDPESVESIADGISKVCRNSKLREELVIKGLKRAGEFSWEKTALQTLEVYRNLIEK